MNLTEQTESNSVKPYKALLIECRRLRLLSRKNLYRRMKILVGVFDDADFRADHGNLDDFKAGDLLNEFIDDCPFDFIDMRRIFNLFPKPKAWREHSIHQLYAKMLEHGATKKDRPLTGVRRPVSAQTREVLENNLIEARKELARTKAQAVSELDQLRARVAELTEENAALKARVAELEAIVGSLPATA